MPESLILGKLEQQEDRVSFPFGRRLSRAEVDAPSLLPEGDVDVPDVGLDLLESDRHSSSALTSADGRGLGGRESRVVGCLDVDEGREERGTLENEILDDEVDLEGQRENTGQWVCGKRK